MKTQLITKIRRTFNRVLKNRQGQSTTEYILILAIVVMIASKMKSGLGGMLEGKVQKLTTDISNFE
jgi:Flp pilus assembly pilin Flp